jgi:hypothetical protein
LGTYELIEISFVLLTWIFLMKGYLKAIILTGLLCVSLVQCGNSQEDTPTQSENISAARKARPGFLSDNAQALPALQNDKVFRKAVESGSPPDSDDLSVVSSSVTSRHGAETGNSVEVAVILCDPGGATRAIEQRVASFLREQGYTALDADWSPTGFFSVTRLGSSEIFTNPPLQQRTNLTLNLALVPSRTVTSTLTQFLTIIYDIRAGARTPDEDKWTYYSKTDPVRAQIAKLAKDIRDRALIGISNKCWKVNSGPAASTDEAVDALTIKLSAQRKDQLKTSLREKR